jgi:transcriptional regulator of NAD metabolism
VDDGRLAVLTETIRQRVGRLRAEGYIIIGKTRQPSEAEAARQRSIVERKREAELLEEAEDHRAMRRRCRQESERVHQAMRGKL